MSNTEQGFMHIAAIEYHQSIIDKPETLLLFDVLHTGRCACQFGDKRVS